MSLPEFVRFENLSKPGERIVGGAQAYYKVLGKRPPQMGEWYLSGAIPMAYQAKANLTSAYLVVEPTHFATPARGHVRGEPVNLTQH